MTQPNGAAEVPTSVPAPTLAPTPAAEAADQESPAAESAQQVDQAEPALTLAPRVADSPLAASTPKFAPPTITVPPPDYTEAGVPSLDFVRDKIEGRYAMSLGSTELAEETPEARSLQEQAAQREEEAHERLEAIRRSLRGESPS